VDRGSSCAFWASVGRSIGPFVAATITLGFAHGGPRTRVAAPKPSPKLNDGVDPVGGVANERQWGCSGSCAWATTRGVVTDADRRQWLSRLRYENEREALQA